MAGRGGNEKVPVVGSGPPRCRHGPRRGSPRTARRARGRVPDTARNAPDFGRRGQPVMLASHHQDGHGQARKVEPFQRAGKADQRIAVGRCRDRRHAVEQQCPLDVIRLAFGPASTLTTAGAKSAGTWPAFSGTSRLTRKASRSSGPASDMPVQPPERTSPPASPDGAWRRRWRSRTHRTARPAPAAAPKPPSPAGCRRNSHQPWIASAQACCRHSRAGPAPPRA
jgi:hypothetical protein